MTLESKSLRRSLLPAWRHSRLLFAIAAAAMLLACMTSKPVPAVEKPAAIGTRDDPEIAFPAKTPVMDGTLDPDLAALPAVPLPVFENRASNVPASPVSAILAYSASTRIEIGSAFPPWKGPGSLGRIPGARHVSRFLSRGTPWRPIIPGSARRSA
jgi:hypothetical protein